MNSYESVLAALNMEQPEHVPIFEGAIADNIIEALIPGGDQCDIVEKYDLDAVYFREAYHYEPVDAENDLFRDEWGIVMHRTGDVMPTPVRHPIKNEVDLKTFIPPDPRAPHRLEKLRDAVKRFKGEKAVVLGMSDAYAIPWKLRGMSEFLLDMATNPEFVKKLINMVVEYNCELVQSAADIGVDIIRCTDDYAFNTGPMFSPQMWQEYIAPGLRQIVETTHHWGLKFVKHTDGLIDQLVDPILETGIDGLHPIEPLPGQSLKEYKAKYGGRVCLIGNVDCKQVLTSGTRDDVIADVCRCLHEGAANGGYMIASSNSIHSGTRAENFEWYIEAAHKFGAYPINC